MTTSLSPRFACRLWRRCFRFARERSFIHAPPRHVWKRDHLRLLRIDATVDRALAQQNALRIAVVLQHLDAARSERGAVKHQRETAHAAVRLRALPRHQLQRAKSIGGTAQRLEEAVIGDRCIGDNELALDRRARLPKWNDERSIAKPQRIERLARPRQLSFDDLLPRRIHFDEPAILEEESPPVGRAAPRCIDELIDHDAEEAVGAAREALALNPRSSAAWEVLGEVALMGFDFDGAERAAAAMCDAAAAIDPAQPCLGAARLRAESACCRFDSAAALDALAAARVAAPQWMEGLALEAAAKALTYDFDAMRAALAAADALAPGSGSAWMVVGRFLSLGRQYREAADVLAEAARREPAWSAPRNELGLLEMQAGRDREALDALTEAQRLDPYDKRVRFSKMLVEEMMGWRVWESEHFRVRCKPGVDEVLAEDMPAQLEAMHAEVTKRFDHVPKERTTIELMPDHRHFGVRITGMPQIHTVAASTGPVIALEPPREGGTGGSIGRFDWLDTLRHEFVHTVTLDRTANRIPHWFTEAVAVDTERRERDWPTYELLARTLQQDALFDLDEIKWAFVRPKKPSDRSQAYAQGHWMVQFMREAYGQATITQLLDRAARGEREADAFVAVLGISRERFMADFKVWAAAQVDSWGLAAKPPLTELLKSAQEGEAPADGEAAGAPISSEQLEQLLAQHPLHPDLLELAARRAVREADAALPESAVELLRRYAQARPLDPWPRRRLAAVAIDAQRWDEARGHLAFLDAREDADPAFALELARIERLRKEPRTALQAAERAARIDPFNAPTRELAAACAVEAGELSAARRHVLALTRIEPTRDQHRRRLERLDALIAERTAPAK